MLALLRLSRWIDALNGGFGRIADYAVVLAVLISAGNAMIRYGFDISSNAWLEIQWYLFTVTVMLGAAYTLRRNEHVRVDILYNLLSPRNKLWLDLIGTAVFLITTMLALAWLSWPRLHEAWRIQEVSSNTGGLLRWPVLALMPLGFVLVALQGVSEMIKRAAALHGDTRYESHYERPVQ